MNAWAKDFIKNSKGFTIVELLIVLVVIGILAAILFIGYGAVQNNAQDTAFKADLSRVGDEIKLITLDNNGVPAGGATSSLTGDSTVLSGVNVSPDGDLYDLGTSNLFYCAGDIDNIEQFALVAKSKRGVIFSYNSDGGITQLPGSTTMSYSSVCPAAGFSAPYTWSYGYNPLPQYQWFRWAYGGDMITNLAVNPGVEANTGWISNNGGAYPVAYETSVVRSGNRSLSGANLSASTTLLSAYALGGSDSNGFEITSGGDYTGSIYFRAEAPHQGRISVSYRNGGVWSSSTASSYVPGDINGWTRVSVTVTVPNGADRLRFGAAVTALSTEPAGTKGFVDDLMVTKGSEVENYADGTTSGWEWNGAAHASTSTGPPKGEYSI